MYHVCDKAGHVIQTFGFGELDKARKRVEGTNLHIRYSQEAIALENRRRQFIASVMAEATGAPKETRVTHNFPDEPSDVVKLAKSMKGEYERRIKEVFAYQQTTDGDMLVPRKSRFAGA